jgi:hypothetical protein
MSEPHDHATVERERPEQLVELLRADIKNQGGSGKNLKQLKRPDTVTTPTSRHGGRSARSDVSGRFRQHPGFWMCVEAVLPFGSK